MTTSEDPVPVQESITSYWNLRAVSYDEHASSQLTLGPAKDAWVGVWRGALPGPPAEVLDVGTGPGYVALLLAELGHRVTGIDLSTGMLAAARAKSAGTANPALFQVGDAVAPPFPPASFDAVVSRYLLWTLREPLLALTHWRQLLRPGGVLAAVDGNWFADGPLRGDGNSCADDYRRLYDEQVMASLPLSEARTIDRAAGLAREAGFADVRVAALPDIDHLNGRTCPIPPTRIRASSSPPAPVRHGGPVDADGGAAPACGSQTSVGTLAREQERDAADLERGAPVGQSAGGLGQVLDLLPGRVRRSRWQCSGSTGPLRSVSSTSSSP